MNAEEQLISAFYSNLQKRDYHRLLECYHPDIFFYDPVFGNLEGRQVRGMWIMLLSTVGELKVQREGIEGADGYGGCSWSVSYVFPPTKRKVVNKGKAHFAFSEGRIVEHQDDFPMWRWCTQAFGIKGLLLGWTPVFQNKVRRKVRMQLERFMIRKMN